MFKKPFLSNLIGLKTLVVLAILLFSAIYAYTHSGRTDKWGGHHDRKNGGYHFHNSGTTPQVKTPSLPQALPLTTPSLPNTTTNPWSEIYFPTRIEWITLQLNACFGNPATVSFWNNVSNVITVNVYHTSTYPQTDHRGLMQSAKNMVREYAKAYNCGSSIKIEGKYIKMPHR